MNSYESAKADIGQVCLGWGVMVVLAIVWIMIDGLFDILGWESPWWFDLGILVAAVTALYAWLDGWFDVDVGY